MTKHLVIPLWVLACLIPVNQIMAAEPDFNKCLQNIDREIQVLVREYPQLADYPKTRFLDPEGLTISYQFHTHRSHGRGGWTSGVPNPDPDGIWFHIDFHDPDSQAQIHTQPVVSTAIPCGKKVAFMLSMEGQGTRPVLGRIWTIVERVVKDSGIERIP